MPRWLQNAAYLVRGGTQEKLALRRWEGCILVFAGGLGFVLIIYGKGKIK